MEDKENRQKVIVKTSIVGIAVNCALAAFKIFVALISSSIAVLLDAVNNLSDALSSIITIIGAWLAGKPADKKHPFGYGRMEYLSAMIISVIVLYAGVTSFVESIKKIIKPQIPEYSAVSLVIISVAVVAKIVLGLFVKSRGKKVNSDSLIASGQDALMDSIISLGTLVAAVIFLVFGIKLEAWLGAVISVFIIKSGIEMLLETLSEILGQRAEASLSKSIKETVCTVPGVTGAYDLVLNNYGPDSYIADIHIAVPDTWTAREIDKATRTIQALVMQKHGVIISAVGIYSINSQNDRAMEIKKQIESIVKQTEHVLQMHGFYADEETKMISFDIVIDFAAKDKKAVHAKVLSAVKERFPDYNVYVQADNDTSD